ncbi:MAG: hypothetical protein QOD48_692 [Gaiellaceae bacterium]|nr:hypothetical protein [Gaiellaceae bacterium]
MRSDREDINRLVGEVRERDLDRWVEVNGGWVVRNDNGRGSATHYVLPRELVDTDDDPSGDSSRSGRRLAEGGKVGARYD